MSGFLLDTHAWIWLQRRDLDEVGPEFLAQVELWQQQGSVYVSAVSAWEIARLVSDGQLDLGQSVDEFVITATEDDGLKLLELSVGIMIESTRLPGLIHRDPADRVLAATARQRNLTLVTRDKQLIAYAGQGYLNARKL